MLVSEILGKFDCVASVFKFMTTFSPSKFDAIDLVTNPFVKGDH